MTVPDAAATEFARRLVLHETARSSISAASGVENACRALSEELTGVLGAGGVAAIVGRALNLAKRQHPILGDVTVVPGQIGQLGGLSDALATQKPEPAAEAAIAVLAHYIGLMITLLGEDLGMQPVRKLWPRLTGDGKETRT